MLLDAVDINILKMNTGKTTNVLCIYSIPTGTIVLPIVYISEDAEQALGFCYIRKMISCHRSPNTIRESIGYVEYLLPEDQIHIHLPVKVRECKILSLMVFNILRYTRTIKQ